MILTSHLSYESSKAGKAGHVSRVFNYLLFEVSSSLVSYNTGNTSRIVFMHLYNVNQVWKKMKTAITMVSAGTGVVHFGSLPQQFEVNRIVRYCKSTNYNENDC